MKIDRIFIVHYESLIERKDYLDSILPKLEIDFEYFSSNSSKDQILLNVESNFYQFNSNVYNRRLNNNEICVTIQHFKIYEKIINDNLENCLIIEDDAIFNLDVWLKLELFLNQLPEGYDIFFISEGCNLRSENIQIDRLVYKNKLSRCATGYIINKSMCHKLINSLPFSYPIDWHFNIMNKENKFNFYWSEPCVIKQGSEHQYKSNLR
jgi:glycosyl transferase family 25